MYVYIKAKDELKNPDQVLDIPHHIYTICICHYLSLQKS